MFYYTNNIDILIQSSLGFFLNIKTIWTHHHSRHSVKNMNRARKKQLLVLTGGLLTVVCGSLVGIGLILSWYPPYSSLADFLKFVFHPITLLFFVGMVLLYRGLSLRDE